MNQYRQFSMVFGKDSRRLPETLSTFNFDRQPIEFGSDFSWFERTSSTTMFSSLAVIDSGMLCSNANVRRKMSTK
jgi:hypothetical protein